MTPDTDERNQPIGTMTATQVGVLSSACSHTENARICISGYYGANSTGDNAILSQFIHEMAPNRVVNLTIITQGADRAYEHFARPNIRVIDHIRLFGHGGLRNLVKGKLYAQANAISHCNLLVVGGGSLLHDRLRLRNLLMTLDEIWWAKLRRRPVAIFSIGVGPLNRKLARWLVAKTVSMCDLITVRDDGSKQLLVQIGVAGHRIMVVADPAFLLTPAAVTIDRAPWLRGTGVYPNAHVGVYVCNSLEFLSPSGRRKLVMDLAACFDELHDRFRFEFVFLPFSTMMEDDDRIMAYDIAGAMKNAKSTHVIDRLYEPEEMLWIEGKFAFNITMRFHALLFSLCGAVPTIAIEYDPKVGHTMREFGLAEYLIPIDENLNPNLLNAVSLAHEARGRYVDQIRRELPSRRNMAGATFRLLRNLLAASTPSNISTPSRSDGFNT